MNDFSLKTYTKLIITLHQQGFEFLRFKDFQTYNESQKRIVLRQDVDARKENSLIFAKIQYKIGVVGTYYFRIVAGSFNEKIIREITELGHEIGYHYENMSSCCGNIDNAYNDFCKNLEEFRKIYPVKTICMHGSPLSKFDNREIWRKYDYHNLGIIAEPYFDVNFDEVLYLTDTGRRWDSDKFSIRDKVAGSTQMKRRRDEETKRQQNKHLSLSLSIPQSLSPSVSQPLRPSISPSLSNSYKFHSTFDIIKAAEEGRLPDRIMMTFHPQRWTDKPIPWMKELVWQNAKNVGKYALIHVKGNDL